MNIPVLHLRFSGAGGWRLAAVAIVGLAACAGLHALDPERSVFQYGCENWSRENGLPLSSVKAIAQTKDGYIWLGTQQGLMRFDGIDFTSIHVPHQPIFVSQNISTLAPARDGGLWFGLKEGAVGHFDGRTFSPLNASWVEPNMQVFAVREASDGAVWVAWNFGYARWLPGGMPVAPSEKSIGFVPYRAVYEDSVGRIWVIAGDGGAVYYWSTGERHTLADPTLRGNYLFAIAEDHQHRLWIGTQVGLRCYDANLRPVPLSNYDSYAQVNALLVDRHGVLWIGTDGEGLVCHKNGVFTRFTTAHGLVNDHVDAFYEDAEGNLWIGTRGGLTQLTDVKFPLYSAPEGIVGEPLGVAPAGNDGVLVATTKGVARIENGRASMYVNEHDLESPYIKRAWRAANGDLYAFDGERRLLVIANGKVVTRFQRADWPVAITEDAQGVIVSFAGELCRVTRDACVPFTYKRDPPPLIWVVNLWPARDGSLWAATHRGVWQIKDGEYRQWSTHNGLSGSVANWVIEDAEGAIWVGLATGVARIKDGRLQNISRENGLFDNFIYAIVPDEAGWLWFDSSAGIFRVRRRELNDFADGRIARIECESFTSEEAVRSIDKYAQEPTAAKTKDGRIWFSTAAGVVAVDPARIRRNEIPPRVYIQRVRINDQEFTARETLALSAGRGDLEFHYTALSFIAPEKIQFRYRLEGYDDHWIDAGDRRSAFYTNLKPGDYRFQVLACNADGVWNKTGDSIAFTLPPHFFQTRWFMALSVFAGAAGVIGLYAWRVEAMRRRQRMLQEMNDALEQNVQRRTAELEQTNHQLKDEIAERQRYEREAEKMNRQLLVASREAGMAEVATSVLHNVGNVLNSVNVSVSVLHDRVRKSRVDRVAKVAEMLVDNADSPAFLSTHEKGRKIPGFLGQLSQHLTEENGVMQRELESLRRNVEHIKDIVQMQQNYSRLTATCETVEVSELIEDAVRLSGAALAHRHLTVNRTIESGLALTTDKSKILQILVNVLRNAIHACADTGRGTGKIDIRVALGDANRVVFEVRDDGVGIARENLALVFTQGFTTRKDGHGYGLHSSALAAKALQGSLIAHSDGPGRGALFRLELPMDTRAALDSDH